MSNSLVSKKMWILILLVAAILVGCGREPETDCDKGLCGQKWAMELDSAVAHGVASVQAQPNDVNALLALADAFIQKASFIKNQTDTRADFWLSSNLKKIDSLLDIASGACDKALLQKQDSAEVYDLKGRVYLLKSQLRGEWEMSANLTGVSISYHEKAVSLKPISAEMWYHLGIARHQVWWWSQKTTQECFQKAIELDPTFAKAFAALAWYGKYIEGGIYSDGPKFGSENLLKVNRFLNEALRASDDPEVLRVVADMYSNSQVKIAYIKSIQSIPNVVKAPFVLGLRSFLSRSGVQESEVFKRIVGMDHHFSKDHRSLVGYSLEKLSDYDGFRPPNSFEKRTLDDAVRHFKIWAEAIGGVGLANADEMVCFEMSKVYPTSAWVYLYWGKLNENDKALGLFKKAIALDSNFAIGYYLLAATEAEKQDWASAERWLTEALRRGRNDEFVTLNAHLLSALIHARKGTIPKAIQECSLALRIDSAYVKSALRWGIYSRGNRRNQLLFRLDEPISIAAARTDSERKIASLLNLSSGWGYWLQESWGGKYNKFFQKAIDLDPENLEAYFALASMYSFDNQYNKQIDMIKRVIQLHPKNAEAHDQLGNLYLNKNMLDKAREELELAHRLGDFRARIALDDVDKSQAHKDKQ